MKNLLNTIFILLTIFQKINGQNTVDNINIEFRKDPIEFKVSGNLDKYVDLLNNQEIDNLIKLLYGGTTGIISESKADQGIMGKLNVSFNKVHNRVFQRRIQKNGISDKKLLLIEGDSWFNFPIPFKADITKILRRKHKENILLATSASGGDWVSKMLQDQSFFDKMIKYDPDAIILSGGGNDIVGERLSSFITKKDNNKIFQQEKFKFKEKAVFQDSKDAIILNDPNDYFYSFSYGNKIPSYDIIEGTSYLNKYFFNAIVQIELQYKLILKQISNEQGIKVNKTRIITQGYDYPIPNNKTKNKIFHLWQLFINKLLHSGRWLHEPMLLKGIEKNEDQEKIAKAMIFYFNEMLIDIANKKDNSGVFKYPNVFHIDNRGLINKLSQNNNSKEFKFWFDELHPRRKPMKIIADQIEKTVLAPSNTNKVIKIINSK